MDAPISNTVAFLDLSAAVDVYSEWVDACDAVAKENTEENRAWQTSSRSTAGKGGGAVSQRDIDQDADDDEVDVGGYEGEGIVGDDEY
jgi:transcription elongation factor Elf1